MAARATTTITPAYLWDLCCSRRWLVAASTLATAALALLGGLAATPKFEASATVLLDPTASSGLLGSLSMLAPIAGGMGASTPFSEIAVLRSRAVVESTILPPAGDAPPRPGQPGFERHVGLTTRVLDEGQTVGALFLAELAGPQGARPPVQPEARLFARAELASPDAPRRVRVSFRDAARVCISTPRLASSLRLASAEEEEHVYVPGQPLSYRGLELVLDHSGDLAGRSFLVEAVAPYEAALDLAERLTAVETLRGSGVLRISVEDSDPYRCAETANALVANYLAAQEARRETRSGRTRTHVEGLLAASRASLKEAQAELVEVQASSPGVINLDASAEALIGELGRLAAAAQTLALRQSTLADVAARMSAGDQSALAELDAAVTGGTFVDPLTEGYLASLAAIEVQRSTLTQAFRDDHPRLQELAGAAVEQRRLIHAQVESRAAGLARQRGEIAAEIDLKTASLALLPKEALALAEPLLEVRTQEALIPELVKNLKASEIADQARAFAAQLLDAAEPATELAAPQLEAVGAIGAALGMIAGVLLALARESSAQIRGRADLESCLERPLLGVVPLGRRGAEERLEGAVRSLRAAIKNLRVGGERVRLLGFTSVGGSPARALVAASLARAFAREGVRVALVEADLDERPLTRLFGLEDTPGMADALRADAPEPLLATGDTPGLCVVPAGRVDAGDAEWLGSERFDRILAGLDVERDLVLVDLPQAGSPELAAIAPKLDGVLLACQAFSTHRNALREACENIERAGGTLLGSVLVGGRGRGGRHRWN
jgi:uncharacterized protein involved in exopolysaccharide biosynthesis/Mrp family chromosome partitioning ATPase